MDGGVRAINGQLDRPDQRARRITVVTARLLGLDPSVQRIGDLAVSVSCGVLVDQRCAIAVLSRPRVEVGQACPALCGEGVAGMA
jgi:hypothetical protein